MRTHKFLAIAAAAVIAVTLSGCQLVADQVVEVIDSAGGAHDSSAGGPYTAQVIRVVDGDTIAVEPTADLPATNESGTEHVVRLLSIDTPEMNKTGELDPECGAQAATDHLASLVDGATVTLTFDPRSDHTDRYGRSLVYVELDDGADVALEMLEAGYAEAWYPQGEPEPERFVSYLATQGLAQTHGAGAYATCDSIGR